MFYNLLKTPVFMKSGRTLLGKLDLLLNEAHLIFPDKILVTQENLYESYKHQLSTTKFSKILYVCGGKFEETNKVMDECRGENAIIIAFGGGSVLDVVKYSASKMDMPYVAIPSALSNDGICSCIARLTRDGMKVSLDVQPPIGIIIDFDVIAKAPKVLLYAGIADLVSNLSAIQDWRLAYHNIGEPINELAYILAKEAALPMLRYSEKDMGSDQLLKDLANGLITSGLSMIASGNSRGTSGAEHLISHAIDLYYPGKSTIHGIQVGWAQGIIAKRYRNDPFYINEFHERIGLTKVFEEMIPWTEADFDGLINYAMTVRKRYTVFNTI